MTYRKTLFLAAAAAVALCCTNSFASDRPSGDEKSAAKSNPSANAAAVGSVSPSVTSAALAAELGISFGESPVLILQRDGKRYEINTSTRTVRELADGELPGAAESSSKPAVNEATNQGTQDPDGQRSAAKSPNDADATSAGGHYRAGDDLLFSVPTGRMLTKRSWVINFTHRFPYEAAFTGTIRGNTLLGLDDFAVASFGLTYAITNRLSVNAYRSPSILGRPLELGIRYDVLQERHHGPFNAALRFSVDGQNDMQRNFTTNLEVIASRSLGRRAQLYVNPTVSIHNRPLIAPTSQLSNPLPYQPCSSALAAGVPASFRVKPCANTFSIGTGIAVDIRPTVTLLAEAIPTAVNGTDLGIHRVPFSFGIQKKLYHHAFTFGFSTGPGTTTAQRIGTRSILVRDPHGDRPSKMFVGFNIMRQF